jgi:hypothetical protein
VVGETSPLTVLLLAQVLLSLEPGGAHWAATQEQDCRQPLVRFDAVVAGDTVETFFKEMTPEKTLAWAAARNVKGIFCYLDNAATFAWQTRISFWSPFQKDTHHF